MAPPQNQAAYLKSKQSRPLEVSDAPFPKPGADEVVIKNAAVAVNPVDWKIQDMGYFVQKFPFILGTDVAGTVEEVGSEVRRIKKGDRVLGHAISLGTQKNEQSGFQLYTSAPAITVAPIPASMSFAEASVLPLAINTAVTGLYPQDVLGLPYPTVEDSSPSSASKRTVLVIGGSSSVGTVAIQLAHCSGLNVISTASAKNHDYVKSLGASSVFDHNDSDVANQIAEKIKSSGTSFAGTYDAISLPNTHQISFAVAKALGNGGSRIATTLPAPDDLQTSAKDLGITFHNVFAVVVVTDPKLKDICDAVWHQFLPAALETGRFKALPEPLVVGKGLESVQKGLDRQKEGVSAKKVIIEL